MPLEIVQVDAFTRKPFTGNPAVVCILDGESVPADWQMQEIAREMNVSETAFLIPHEDGFDLRWFTPTTEVDLCGHATLASAFVLWADGHLDEDATARFHTRSGILTARRRGEWVELDFPADKVVEVPATDALRRALGEEPLWVGSGTEDLVVELSSEKVVRTLTPDLGLLSTIESRAIVVTAESISDHYDFVSRVFAPRFGIPEDPVTGSAHCALGPIWAARLGRNELTGYQVSDRGGTVKVTVDGGDRVRLSGQAVIVMRGTLLV